MRGLCRPCLRTSERTARLPSQLRQMRRQPCPELWPSPRSLDGGEAKLKGQSVTIFALRGGQVKGTECHNLFPKRRTS